MSWLIKQWRKLLEPGNSHPLYGHWRVYYPDCKQFSMRMSYSHARNYAEIFKGELTYSPNGALPEQEKDHGKN